MLLESRVVIAYLRGRLDLRKKVLPSEPPFLPLIALGELDKGALKSQGPADNLQQISDLMALGVGAESRWEHRPEIRPRRGRIGAKRRLDPGKRHARICSYECTFCADCVERVLFNVCPNCGGGFTPRPIRPAKNWKGGNWLGADPAGTTVKHRPVAAAAHAVFAAKLRTIRPESR